MRRVGAGLVGLLHDESHVDDHPVACAEGLLGQHADVDLAVLARDVDEGELVAVAVEHPDDLSWDPQTHGFSPPRGRRLSGDQARQHVLDRRDGVGHGRGHRMRQVHALVDVGDLATDHDGARRRAAQRRRASRTPPPDPCCVRRDRRWPRGFRDQPRRRARCRAHRDRAGRRRAPARPSPRAGRRPGACRGCHSRRPSPSRRRSGRLRAGRGASHHLGSESVVSEEDVADSGDQDAGCHLVANRSYMFRIFRYRWTSGTTGVRPALPPRPRRQRHRLRPNQLHPS